MRTAELRKRPTNEIKTRHCRAIQVPANGTVGAPSVYDPIRFPHIAGILCKEYGFTAEQLGKVFGVSVKTVNYWMLNRPEFKKAVQEGRDDFDGNKVENALLKIALGYKYKETTKKRVHLTYKTDEGKASVPAIEVTTVEKELPPNVKALTFWLTNRRRDRWQMVINANVNVQGKVEHNHTGVVATAAIENLNKDQLMALRDMIALQNNKTVDGSSTPVVAEDVVKLLEHAQSVMDAEYEDA